MLQVNGLRATVNGQEILKGVDLALPPGQVHAIMGPNGSGKSTLAGVLAGRPVYQVTGGQVRLGGQDLLALDPEERAALGVFLGFQYPVEIPGVGNLYFLRTALNAVRRTRGEEELDAMDFLSFAREKMKLLELDPGLSQPLRQRGLLRRREEAERDLPDGGAGAEARHPRRDRLRPRHRRAPGGRTRRQLAAPARPLGPAGDALQAAPRVRPAGPGARHGRRDGSSARAGRSWPTSWSGPATPGRPGCGPSWRRRREARP